MQWSSVFSNVVGHRCNFTKKGLSCFPVTFEKLSEQILEDIYERLLLRFEDRGVLRTVSNIYDGTFLLNAVKFQLFW